MRKVTAGLFHSVDGVVEDPFKFQFDSFDDALGEMLTGVQERVDTCGHRADPGHQPEMGRP